MFADLNVNKILKLKFPEDYRKEIQMQIIDIKILRNC